MFTRRRRAARLRERHALHAVQPAFEQRVGAALNPSGDVSIGRSAVRRVVFESAVVGRIVRRRDHDAVGAIFFAAAVVDQDRVRDRGRRREFAVGRNHDGHAVRGKHFERGFERRLRQRVRVGADEQRAIDVLRGAVFADRLSRRENVPFVETARERTAAVAGCAERDALIGHRRVGPQVDIGGEQFGHVDERGTRRGFTSQWIDLLGHAFFLVIHEIPAWTLHTFDRIADEARTGQFGSRTCTSWVFPSLANAIAASPCSTPSTTTRIAAPDSAARSNVIS